MDELELTTFPFSDAKSASPEESISTDVNMIPGDSTLNVLAEMVEDPMSDAEPEAPPAEYGTNYSTTENIPAPTALDPVPTPTPPVKTEPSPPSRPPVFNIDPDPDPSAVVNYAARSQGIPPPPEKPPSRNLQKAYSDPSAFHTVNSIQSRQLPSSALSPHTATNKPDESYAGGHDYDPLQVQDQMEDQGQIQIQDQGPWTCEAMDLFDFWPPGRLKTAA